MVNFWPSCGFTQLERNARGWLVPTEAYLRLFLARPELALVPESCTTERALHAALLASPLRPVTARELAALQDDDARENYATFLGFRDSLLAAGTLERYYLDLFLRGTVNVPPLFVDLIAQAILRNVLDKAHDPVEARAAEMLFRSQRITNQDGQILSGDRTVLDMYNETGGLGEMGRLLKESKAPLRTINLEVLGGDNAVRYWQSDEDHAFLLDLTHELTQNLGHGLTFTVTRARSGLTALARVLEKWVHHFLGVTVHIQPEQKIDDAAWRWHVGLDTESTAILNDLYQDQPVAPERLRRMISLFRLDFANPNEMRADVAGKTVYLGLAMNAEGVTRIKPQNLLTNLPLATAM
ncbi:MAG: DUF6352 family protein [Rhodoferax sp.]|nr:DUF6352 family protein [Rhodoferax sp.]